MKGGKRTGAGRKKGEPTKVVRVPVRLLRDEFAMAALAGILAEGIEAIKLNMRLAPKPWTNLAEFVPQQAYCLADAMLAERNKTKDTK